MPPTSERSPFPAAWLALPPLVAVLGGLSTWPLPAVIGAMMLAASALALVAYARDKAAARAGSWRVPEHRLHLLALLGGWPGALLATRLWRHKTAKAGFQAVLALTVLLHLAATVALWRALAAP